jgi:hypothetical protein
MIIPIRLFLPILSLRVYFLGVLAFSDQQILRKYQGGILHRFVISESHDLEHLLEIAQVVQFDHSSVNRLNT